MKTTRQFTIAGAGLVCLLQAFVPNARAQLLIDRPVLATSGVARVTALDEYGHRNLRVANLPRMNTAALWGSANLSTWQLLSPLATQVAANAWIFQAGTSATGYFFRSRGLLFDVDCPYTPTPLTNATLVSSPTRAALQAALDAGGHIAFDLGAVPATIPIDQTLSITQPFVMDGGGLITLDGQNTVRIMEKAWTPENLADPFSIELQNLRFIRGRTPTGATLRVTSGGALFVDFETTLLRLFRCTFEDNHTTDINQSDNQGGALFATGADLVAVDCLFTNNSAGNGGAIGEIASSVQLYRCRFSNNRALDDSAGGIVRGYGGAVHVDGVLNDLPSNRLHVAGCVFENNTAIRGGGAFSSVISDNAQTRAQFLYCSFVDNEVFGQDGNNGQGGGLYHIEDDHAGGREEQNLLIQGCAFENNRALRQGGGAWLYIMGFGQVFNSTFSSNRAYAGEDQVGQGGGLAINLGRYELTHCTFVDNFANLQGGAIMAGGANSNLSVQLSNCLFDDNLLNIGQTIPFEAKWQGFHSNRQLQDGGGNMQHPRYKPVYSNDANNWVTADPIFADPLLEPPQENGGPTRTCLPGASSPARNAGVTNALDTGMFPYDQRGGGFPRNLGDRPDIGAVEVE